MARKEGIDTPNKRSDGTSKRQASETFSEEADDKTAGRNADAFGAKESKKGYRKTKRTKLDENKREKKKKKMKTKEDGHSEEETGCEEGSSSKKDETKKKKNKSDEHGLEAEKNNEEGPYIKKDKKKKKKKTKSDEGGSRAEKIVEEGPSRKKDEKKKKKANSDEQDVEAEKIGEGEANDKKNEKNQKNELDKDGSEEEKDCNGGPYSNMVGKEKKKKIKSNEHVLEEEKERNGDVYSSNKDEKEKKKRKKTDKHLAEELSVKYDISSDKVGKKKRKKSKSDEHEKKRKKSKSDEHGSEENNHKGVPRTKKKSKRVSFSNEVEIFPQSTKPNKEKGKNEEGEDGLIRGKRFSIEEDEILKKAVLDYIEMYSLGEEGLDMILHCKKHPQVKNCWKDIGQALPNRPHSSIYYRAHILFQRGEKRKWSKEEYELVRRFHEKHGADWKMLAEGLGKHRFHVKDTWRRIKLPNRNKGQWSQDEYQNLFDLVNTDLRMKAFEEKKTKHGMLRDNICWEAISSKLSTRNDAICCMKWYRQLTSPMVADGLWADTDDYRLLDALSSFDACSIEDVEWDDLIEHRPGDVCRKRWNQMVMHIGQHGSKSFSEQVEILSKRYCSDVLDARLAYDSGNIDLDDKE